MRKSIVFTVLLLLSLATIISIVEGGCSGGICDSGSSSLPSGWTNWGVTPTKGSSGSSSGSCTVRCSTCASGYCNDCNHDGICDSPEGSSSSGSCTVRCSTCATGYCDDCNHDGICDSPEGYTPSSGSCTVRCSTCATGYCDDCNHDGICDSPEGYTPSSGSCLVLCPNCASGYCNDCNDDGICDGTSSSGSQSNTITNVLIVTSAPINTLPPTPTPTANKYKVITKVVTKAVKAPTNLAVVVKTARPLNSGPTSGTSQGTAKSASGTTPTQTAGSSGVSGPVFQGANNQGTTGPVGSLQWSNENSNPVLSGPNKPTTILFQGCVKLVSLKTVHWNEGKGQAPGTLSLRHQDGTVYGPWNARGEADRTGVPNVNWVVEPQMIIKAGTYTVIDSDSRTWSYNSGTQGSGIAIASYDQVNCPAGMGTPVPTVVKPTVAPAAGQNVVISSSIGNSMSSSGSSFSFGSGGTSFSSGGFSVF